MKGLTKNLKKKKWFSKNTEGGITSYYDSLFEQGVKGRLNFFKDCLVPLHTAGDKKKANNKNNQN